MDIKKQRKSRIVRNDFLLHVYTEVLTYDYISVNKLLFVTSGMEQGVRER